MLAIKVKINHGSDLIEYLDRTNKRANYSLIKREGKKKEKKRKKMGNTNFTNIKLASK